MPLPTDGQAWPPAEWAPAFQQYALNDALYVGSVDALHALTAGLGPGVNAGRDRGDSNAAHYNTGRRGGIRGLFDSIRTWWWGRAQQAGQSRTFLHSPMAGNLATLSADTLMSEAPAYHLIGEDGEVVKGPAQDRLDAIMTAPGTQALMMQAAEYCAGLSAVALVVHWDAENTDRPWFGLVAADAVVPEWEAGILSAVTMWTTHPKLNQAGSVEATYYHLERHEPGAIVHALYLGTDTELGRPVPLDTLPELEYLLRIPGGTAGPFDGSVSLPTGIERLTATWWRNLPTRQFRKAGILSRCGRADTEGVEHWLDQIDMVWSSWMRDIKLARARLIVGSQMLDVSGTTVNAPTFDDDAEILKALDFTPTNPDDPPLSAHQFEIRAEEHARTILELTKEILHHAGYSLASYGEHGGDTIKTATEISDRKSATERTRDKKALYFRDAVEPLILAMLDIDKKHYAAGVGMPTKATLEIAFPEQSQVDPEAQARTFQYLRAAMAASTRTLVAERHPEWDSKQVEEEVALILEENNLGQEADPGELGRDGEPIDEQNPGEEDEPPADEDEETDDAEAPRRPRD